MNSFLTIQAHGMFQNQGRRPAQEDYALLNDRRGVFAISDGFGGPLPGSAASKAACEAIQSFLSKEAGDQEATLPFLLRSYFSLAGNVLFNALIHANRQVMALNQGKSVNERAGASALAGLLDGNLLALANVGGCQATLVRGGVAQGLLNPRIYGRLLQADGAATDLVRSVPLMALGICQDLEPEIWELRVQPGDWVALTTDGVGADWFAVLAALQGQGLDAQNAVLAATESFKTLTFDDNASAVLLAF